MRWREIIAEGRDGYLYHKTSLANAILMIEADRIEARTRQLVGATRGRRKRLQHNDPWKGKLYTFDMKGGETLAGVSLTRDYGFASRWAGEVILVLDQSRLAQRHRIIPHDHVHGGRYDYDSPGSDLDPDLKEQAEEFVVGPIVPLSRYLVSVNVELRTLDHVSLMQREALGAVMKHPLLNRVIPRGHANEYDRKRHVALYGYPHGEAGGYYDKIDARDDFTKGWKMHEAAGQPVMEASDAPLFHFTTVGHLFIMMQEDTLGNRLRRRSDRGRVSLTRDTNHIYAHPEFGRDAVLVLDGRRLGQTHALTPTFGDIGVPPPSRAELVNPELHGAGPTADQLADYARHGSEAEERSERVISPLSRYLSEIVLDPRMEFYDQALPIVLDYAKQHGIAVSEAEITYGRAWFRKRRMLLRAGR